MGSSMHKYENNIWRETLPCWKVESCAKTSKNLHLQGKKFHKNKKYWKNIKMYNVSPGHDINVGPTAGGQ